MDMVYAVIGLALLQYFIFAMLVGRARVMHKVEAPAVTGNETFERYYRAHYNTLEQLIIFLPAILLFANYISPLWAALLGIIFIIGRTIYFRGYIEEPKKRAAGFGLSMLPNLILLLGGLGGAVWAALT